MRFIGDVHGKIESYLFKLDCEESLQIGDMGIGFPDIYLPALDKHKFIRGNHDDPNVCREHYNYQGEFGYLADKGIFYLGGAWSIDKHIRAVYEAKTGIRTWWPDEELSIHQLAQAYKLYVSCKPRIVATHDCPKFMSERIIRKIAGVNNPFVHPTRTARALERMWRFHEPDVWVFGHYHITMEQTVSNTRFICLNELQQIDLT